MKDYKKILEGVIDIISTAEKSDIGFANICTYISENCPELKESEDERVRKALLEMVHDTTGDELWIDYNVHKEEALAWLEKQGEFDDNNITREDEILQAISVGLTDVFEDIGWSDFGGLPIEEIQKWLEKRGKQKPFDYENANIQQKDFAPKDEPKLKIEKGKWYVCIRELLDDYGNRAFCKGDVYLSEKDGYLIPCNSNVPWELSYCLDTYFRNWDISDAKDGDVLVYNNSSEEIILLFKKWMNGVGDGAYSYAHTFDNKIRFNDWSDCGYTAHPATKEQRDFLFTKMKEAGYEWDAEKKELMKIERKPPWSEEDEHRAKDTIYFLDTAKKHYASTVELDACIDWIKSLKKRMEKEVVV